MNDLIITSKKRSLDHSLEQTPKFVKKDPNVQLHEYLLAGKGEDIVRQLESLSSKKVQQRLVYGPQKKSIETAILEKIINDLLTNANSWTITHENNRFYLKQETIIHDFEHLLEKTNFNHLFFEDDQLTRFEKFLYPNGLPPRHYPKITSGPLAQLSAIEERCLYLYTTFDYHFSNHLCGAKLDRILAVEPCKSPSEMNIRFKKLLLKVALQVTTLKKLHFEPPIGNYLYRGEALDLPAETLQERINAVKDGGKVTQVPIFMSTAADEPAGGYLNRTIFTLYQKGQGKDISPLSDFPAECETLFAPTQVQWLLHHQYELEGQTHHLFVARPVTVPVEKPTIEISHNE